MNGTTVPFILSRGKYRVIFTPVDYAEFGLYPPTVAVIAREGPDNATLLNMIGGNESVSAASGVVLLAGAPTGLVVDYEDKTVAIPLAPWSGLILFQRLGNARAC